MKQIICMAFIAMMLQSCNKHEAKTFAITLPDTQQKQSPKDEDKSSYKADTAGIAGNNNGITPSKNQPASTHEDWDKKIIKTADVRLELKDYTTYNNAIHKNVKSFGAYIAKEEQTQNNGNMQNNITIKVPVDQFEGLINSFGGEGIKILEKKINSEDVTSEVVDTKSRMEAKKQVRLQYLELLKQARNMKDILEVQNEINSIQEDIEAAAGRINYLTHQSVYSTINLTYYQYSTNINHDAGEANFLTKVKEAFSNGVTVIESILLFVINFWPVIIVIFIAILFWKRKKMITVQHN